MQEFSTVAASAYDAESLTPLLNDKAAEGWSVVSIVAAGPNVVAYLSRDTDGATAAPAATDTPAADSTETTAPAGVAAAGAAAAPTATADTPAASPVDEPAGWGAVGAATASSPVDPGAAETTPAAAPAVEPTPEPEPAPAAAESTVPAGWYADPSGRFELRYWDGNQWTEHVSRDGQQYTDPPVA